MPLRQSDCDILCASYYRLRSPVRLRRDPVIPSLHLSVIGALAFACLSLILTCLLYNMYSYLCKDLLQGRYGVFCKLLPMMCRMSLQCCEQRLERWQGSSRMQKTVQD